jgi:LemA protein
MFGYIFIGVLVLIILYCISVYNSLIRNRNAYKNSFAQIDVQLTRRYELIPNLVETAKKFMAHEQETLEKVIQARNQASQIKIDLNNDLSPENIQKLSQMENTLTQSLGKLFALAENYPDLKSDTTMNQLMEQLSSTENRVAFARQAYNDSVMEYNNSRDVFPANIIATKYRFMPQAQLDIPDSKAREKLNINFN